MKSILIVNGHQNIENLTSFNLRDWRDVATLKQGTGAGGERDYFIKQVTPKLAQKLQKSNINVTVANATFHSETYNKDYDLCIIMHYDGGGIENRCMASGPLRGKGYLNDDAYTASENFIKIWRDIYPQLTDTIYRDERITVSMTENYIFDYVRKATPTVILEHFNATSEKGKQLINNAELVAEADYIAILKFFGINPIFKFSLDENIPAEVEDKYSFLKLAGYNKEWTFSDLFVDYIRLKKMAGEYENLTARVSRYEKLIQQIKNLLQ